MNVRNQYKNSKGVKSNNYFYRKIVRAITIWGAIEISPISIAIQVKVNDLFRTKINKSF